MKRLITEHQAEREAMERARAAGGTCQCQPLAANGVNYLTAVKPRSWLLDKDGNPTCATCRLTVEDWEEGSRGSSRASSAPA